jgi:hypothetical protein
LGHAEDIIAVEPVAPKNLLRRAFRVVADKMPDPETRTEAVRIIDPHLKGGAFNG